MKHLLADQEQHVDPQRRSVDVTDNILLTSYLKFLLWPEETETSFIGFGGSAGRLVPTQAVGGCRSVPIHHTTP